MSQVNFKSHPLGWIYHTPQFQVFFGNRHSEWTELKNHFSQMQFWRVKQVHGDRIIKASLSEQEADGHWTKTKHEALCIVTADCLPIFLTDTHLVIALHAGWRGLQQEIICKAFERLDIQKTTAFIGPHIHTKSFEVGPEVAIQLEQSYWQSQSKQAKDTLAESKLNLLSNLQKQGFTKPQLMQDWQLVNGLSQANKPLVNLLKLAKAQLKSSGLEDPQIHELCIDTYTSAELHSFRRDGSQAGRQISFIAKL